MPKAKKKPEASEGQFKPSKATIPCVRVEVTGQFSTKDEASNARPRIDKYEETFLLPVNHTEDALYIIKNFLLDHRLRSKHENYHWYRTHALKKRQKGEIESWPFDGKKIDDFNEEELNLFIIVNGIDLQIIQENPIYYDLVDKVKELISSGQQYVSPKVKPQSAYPDSESNVHSGYDAEPAPQQEVSSKPGESWEDLDD